MNKSIIYFCTLFDTTRRILFLEDAISSDLLVVRLLHFLIWEFWRMFFYVFLLCGNEANNQGQGEECQEYHNES